MRCLRSGCLAVIAAVFIVTPAFTQKPVASTSSTGSSGLSESNSLGLLWDNVKKTISSVLAAKPASPAPAPASPNIPDDVSGGARVVLYDEDPANPKGVQYVGSVVWFLRPIETPNPLTGGGELAVEGHITVPSRRLKLKMTFKRNIDPTLPASHLLDLNFTLPTDFVGGSVNNVPGLLMKSHQEARGAPLAGLVVKISDGAFLIGLSKVDSDRQRNKELLQERSWFDIPVVYKNQRRAIIAVQKGNSGDKAFKDALTIWEQTPLP